MNFHNEENYYIFHGKEGHSLSLLFSKLLSLAETCHYNSQKLWILSNRLKCRKILLQLASGNHCQITLKGVGRHYHWNTSGSSWACPWRWNCSYLIMARLSVKAQILCSMLIGHCPTQDISVLIRWPLPLTRWRPHGCWSLTTTGQSEDVLLQSNMIFLFWDQEYPMLTESCVKKRRTNQSLSLLLPPSSYMI